MAIMEGTRRLKAWEGYYDFAVDTGATGTLVLRSNDGQIPAGSIIEGGLLDITTAGLSATGTMAFQVEAAADITAALAQAALTTGQKSVIPAFSGVTTVKTTVARSPSVVIATAAFTAGKLKLILFYR